MRTLLRKIRPLLDPMTLWLFACFAAGIALIAHPHFGAGQ